jgi:hypothetical protein
MRRLLGVSSRLVVLVASCSPFVVEQTDRNGAQDASTDVGAVTDACVSLPDANTDAPVVNLHPQGSFRGLDCSPWIPYQSTLTKVAERRSSPGSCQVSSTATDVDRYFAIDDNRNKPQTAITVAVGETYRVSAWVKSCPNQPAPSLIEINGRVLQSVNTFVRLEDHNSMEIEPSACNWLPVSQTFQIGQAGQLNVVVTARAPTSAGGCFLLDDVVVQKLQ